MNRQISGLLGILGALGLTATACKDNPVAAGSGTPSLIVSSPSEATLQGTGKTVTLSAQVLDKTSTPLAQTITATACNSAVTVVPNAVQPVPPTTLMVTVTSAGLNASCVVFSSNGAPPDTAKVIVLPTEFPGTVSTTSPQGGSTLVIHSTATLKFNPATVAVRFPGSGTDTLSGIVVAASADTVAVLVPFGTNGPAIIDGIVVTYVSGLEVSLTGTTKVTQAGNYWAADSSWQTAPDITSWLPASGGSSQLIIGLPALANTNAAICAEVVLGFGSQGPCGLLKFTNTTPDTLVMKFQVDWDGAASNPDVDLLVCADTTIATMTTSASSCGAGGLAGSSASKPEATAFKKYAPGKSYWVNIENYCSGDPNEVNCTAGPSPNHYLTIFRQ